MKLNEIEPVPETVVELFEKYPFIWTRGIGHHGLFDERAMPVDEYKDATCLCLGAAIGFVVKQGGLYDRVLHSHDIDAKAKRVLEVINNRSKEQYLTIPQWNDEEERTFEEVLAIAREAGI